MNYESKDNSNKIPNSSETYIINNTKSSNSNYLYQESIYTTDKDNETIRSLYSPKSWPSGDNLAIDSSAYPLISLFGNSSSKESSSDSITLSESSLNEKDTNINIIQSSVNQLLSIDEHKYFQPTEIFQINQCLDMYEKSLPSISTNKESKLAESLCSVKLTEDENENTFDFNLPFIKDIIKLPNKIQDYNQICFTENLLVSVRNPPISDDKFLKKYCATCFDDIPELILIDEIQEIGGMCLNVEINNNNITIFKTSQFTFEKNGAISSILSIIDTDMNLIEEKRREILCSESMNIEKSLHVVVENDHFVAYRTESYNNNIKHFRGEININVTGNLILDGGGFFLMRHLIKSNFVGRIETYTMDITGEFFRSIYKCGNTQEIKINNVNYEVILITHILIHKNMPPSSSISMYLPSGHLIYHSWSNCSYILHINPYSTMPPIANFVMNLHEKWQDDIQLLSMYLDLKEKRRSDLKTYLKDEPEIQCMIKDYVMCLLLEKPDNILDFTIDYFINFGNNDDEKNSSNGDDGVGISNMFKIH